MALKRFGFFCVFVSGPSFKILSIVEKKDTAHPWVVFQGGAGAGLGYRRQKKEKKKESSCTLKPLQAFGPSDLLQA